MKRKIVRSDSWLRLATHCHLNLSIDLADDAFHLTPKDESVRNWQEIPVHPAKRGEHENLSKFMLANKYTPGIFFKELRVLDVWATFARNSKSLIKPGGFILAPVFMCL